MTPKIALFAERGSRQLGEIAAAVEAEGGRPVVCDIQVGGAPDVDVSAGQDRLCWQGHSFADIRAVHIRCTAPRTLPALPPLLNAASQAEYRAGFLREQEYQAATYAFFTMLAAAGTLVVNPLTSAFVDHNAKGQLYEKLRAWGFRAPRSLTTNDPAVAAAFLDDVGEAVVKPAIGIGSTRLVTAADRLRLAEVAVAPVLLQQRIVGPVVRVHVVAGTMVLALKVLSDTIDSRTAPQGFIPIALAEAEQDAIVRATAALGLHYAGWDAILDDAGCLHYLDCNPGPNLMWLQPAHRSAVLAQLARFLVAAAATGSRAAAAARVEACRV